MYNGVNSSIDAFRGKHDAFGSMAAGGITGLLYKSTGECRLHIDFRVISQDTNFVSWF
jgi:hypothetical protein